MEDKTRIQQWLSDGKSQRQIARMCNVCQTTVRKWLDKYGLSTDPKKYKCGCGEERESEFQKGRYSECKKCRSNRQVGLYAKYKAQAIQYKGGKCVSCGYDKCAAALDFHHLDPSQKDPEWSKMRHRSFEKVRDELDKCVLLCKNCHTELHYKNE